MSEAARFHLPPLRLAATVADLDAWLERAAPGAICVYARGGWLDPACPAAQRARLLADAGAVRLNFRRAGGQGEYLAVKLAGGYARDANDTGGPALPHAESAAGRVYALLVHAARHGQPCPTNRDIARALALGEPHRARYLIDQLVQAGLVTIENRGPRVTRIATITATGARTSAARVAVGKGFEAAGGVR